MKNIAFALSVLCICGFAGVRFYLPKFIETRVREQVDEQMRVVTEDFRKKNDQLAEIVKNIEAQQKKSENKTPVQTEIAEFRVDFERWNCWCDLKNKLRYGNECPEELARFRRMFSNYPDLLKMVDSLVSDEKSELKDDTLINNLLKFVRVYKVNESELEKIAGYVLLLSIGKVEANE